MIREIVAGRSREQAGLNVLLDSVVVYSTHTDPPMTLNIETINHVGIVVRDKAAAERFYIEILGLRRHHARPFWLVLNDTSTLHLIHLADAAADDPRHHSFRHFALQVSDLRAVLDVLLDRDVRVFQTDFQGNEQDVTTRDASLDFGTGSLFVHDPDGNTIEFLQLGHGIFADV
jgi:catechol 2,3-dioxygenase-like lactoylglutathione lyase family enzyme